MMGKRGEDGLYAMAAKDIFGMLDEASRSRPLQVSVALFEIYGRPPRAAPFCTARPNWPLTT
jgi:hypothetical protein